VKKLVIIVIVLAIVGSGGFRMFFRTPVVDPNLIHVLDSIEITVAEVSFKSLLAEQASK
jgi:galactokinase/mevalonate kinase-like predicted kinase